MEDPISSKSFVISGENSKVTVKYFNRGRMKITIKLDKGEAEGFSAFKSSVLPPGANEEEFIKTVFFMGLDQFHKNAISMMQKYVEENEDKLRQEGVDVDAIKTVGKEIAGNIDDNPTDD